MLRCGSNYTGHSLACPHSRAWGFLGSWSLSTFDCVNKFEGLRHGKEYVTRTRADMALFNLGQINDGLLGPLPGLLRPIEGPLGKFAAAADRAVSVAERAITESAAVTKEFAAVSDRAVSMWSQNLKF